MKLADVIRRAVAARKESTSETARGAGIPQPVLHRFMAGERDLTLRTAEKLMKYLGLEVRKR